MTDTAASEATLDAAAPPHNTADEAVMSMLQEHVPLSLICDLGTPDGPGSSDILAEEGQPDFRWWEQ